MIESLLGLLRSNDEITIRFAFDILNGEKITLSKKIEYLNASKYRMLIDPLNLYFDRPGNRLYIIKGMGQVEYFNLGDQYYIPN